MMHKAWSSTEEVPYCFSRSYVKFQGHTALKIFEFDPNWAFPDCNPSFNSPMAMKCCTKLETAKERCPIVFQGHPSNFKVTRDKTSPILTQIVRFRTIGRSQLSNPSDLPCLFCDDDVTKWKHFPRYWPFVRGIHRSPVNSPHNGQWRRALMFSLICARINGWVSIRESGDLRRYRAHYDVIVRFYFVLFCWSLFYLSNVTLSQELEPMAAQLSMWKPGCHWLQDLQLRHIIIIMHSQVLPQYSVCKYTLGELTEWHQAIAGASAESVTWKP